MFIRKTVNNCLPDVMLTDGDINEEDYQQQYECFNGSGHYTCSDLSFASTDRSICFRFH